MRSSLMRTLTLRIFLSKNMARVHFVKKARKNYPHDGIKKGESYYWWAFRYGGKHKSKTMPKQSQLTGSEFLSTVYSFQEELEEGTFEATAEGLEEAKDERDRIVDELRSLADEQTEKRDNMPEGLQYSETGTLLEDRENYCNEFADELEAVDLEISRDDYESDEDFHTAAQEALSDLSGCSYNGE